MQSNVGPGGIRKSRPAMSGGPTCLRTLALASESATDLAVKQAFYRLADEKRGTILVACSKCDWRAAFLRNDLIASHGADYPMPNLLDHLAAPGCSRLGSHWDRCGVHYVAPIEGGR
jgi:hypothetical protein